MHGWWLKAQRQIPPSLYEQTSDALQGDASQKLVFKYAYGKTMWHTFYLFGILRDRIDYDSDMKDIHTKGQSFTTVGKFGLQHAAFWNGEWQLEISHRMEYVNSSAYAGKKRLQHVEIKGNYRKTWSQSASILAGFRQGLAGSQWMPFSPYAYYSQSMGSRIKLLLAAGRKYRLPSFNDLFWSAGGNAELKAESALEYEAGLHYTPHPTLKTELRVYQKLVENWIQWLPTDGIFSAYNLDRVRGEGLEGSLAYQLRANAFDLDLRISGQLNRTRDLNRKPPLRQLIYTPERILKSHLSTRFKTWTFSIHQSWTGKVYTATDHSSYLPGTYLMHASIGKEFHRGTQRLNTWLKVRNLLDREYAGIINYIMPGRHYEFGISLQN